MHYCTFCTYIRFTKNEPNVNYGPLVTMYQYWLISYNKCTTLMQDVNRGNCVLGGVGTRDYRGTLSTFCSISL